MCRCKAQIINLLRDLQDELGLALLFISHDLAIVEHLTHRVAVMYLGKIVEMRRPAHAVRRAAPSLYAGAAVGGAGARSDGEAAADHPDRRRAEPDQPAERLPVPYALPVCVRSLPGRGAAAAAGGRGACVGLPSGSRAWRPGGADSGLVDRAVQVFGELLSNGCGLPNLASISCTCVSLESFSR